MTRPYSIEHLVLSILVLILTNACNDQITLIEDGNFEYEIVWLGDTTNNQQDAAYELQNYLKQISGVELPISFEKVETLKRKILIGKHLIPSLSNQEIAFYVKNENLIITGGSDQAVENAVYEFLEKQLECKWYSPTVAKIPVKKRVQLSRGLKYAYTPEILTRTVHSNLFYNHPAFAKKHKVTQEAFPYYVPEAKVHTFHRFMPEEKFYGDHPEYFALRGAERLPTQLCLTNDDVLKIVKDSVASYFEKYPEASVISVSQDDNQQFCQCKSCSVIDEKEGSHAGTMIHFVNQVALAFPDKTISTLAYQHTRKPPITHPEKNVLVTLCSIECDRSGAIEEKCEDFARDLMGWKKITNDIRIWDYTTQFTNFLAPFPNIHTLAPNIRFFKDNGAKWVFEQHSRNHSELFELRSYLTAKLLWNPKLKTEEIIVDFTDGYYEEGGVYVRKYIDRIHEELGKHPDFFLFLYGDPSQAFDTYLKPELLREYDSYFDSAELAVREKSQVLAKIRTARISTDYAILEASRKNMTADFSLTSMSGDGNLEFNKKTKSRLDRFKATCDNANISLMNEMGFSVQDYIQNFENVMEMASVPNKAAGKKVILETQPKKYAGEDPQTLTDGALGGNGFYANWLGFEGNDLEAIVDLGEVQTLNQARLAFLQVTNHIVFFPKEVTYSASNDGTDFFVLGKVINDNPLTKESKINDIKYFNLTWKPQPIRYIKIKAKNMSRAPYWHHAAGLPVWIFADEIILE